LGTHDVVDSVVVIWPTDQTQTLPQVKANQTLVVHIGDAQTKWQAAGDNSKPKYFSSMEGPAYRHRENDFNDFNVQPLLPNYLSRQGPCLAKADVNGDGIEDIFVGGARSQAGAVFLRNATGGFVSTKQPFIAADSMCEDVSAIFFDADGDGDADLLVGSGGYEYEEKDPLLMSRLYLNNSKGSFVLMTGSLPDDLFSVGCVRAADVDGDG